MFEGQPKGLFVMALANTGERFGFYTILAVFVLFLQDNFGWDEGYAGAVYAGFLAISYFLPILAGALADRIGYGRSVSIGFVIKLAGYVLLSIPFGSGDFGAAMMYSSLLLIAVGTSLFKGQLQVMIGGLYETKEMAPLRDAAFSIFYMCINVGALFSPAAAVWAMDFAQDTLGASHAESYHYAFAVASVSLVVSMAIYYGFRYTFRHVENGVQPASDNAEEPAKELSPAETRSRIIALLLVFAVVISFWMAFDQSGLTLTYFARDFIHQWSWGVETMMFDVAVLAAIVVAIYAVMEMIQAKTSRGRSIAGLFLAAALALLGYKYANIAPEGVEVTAPIFQQFNPFFVIGLTPLLMALFAWLAKRGKEPSTPRKIALGMLLAAVAYGLLMAVSAGLDYDGGIRIAPHWLVGFYLILTVAELLLSPMGISFVSKVAPPKYRGLMMGLWFGSCSIGNLLVALPGYMWERTPLVAVWGVLAGLCLLSAIILFAIMRRLERVC